MIRVAIVAPTPALRVGLRAMLSLAGVDVAEDDVPLRAADVIVTTALDDVLMGQMRADHTQAIVVMDDDPRVISALRTLPLRGWAVLPAEARADELDAAVRAAALGLAALPIDRVGAFGTGPDRPSPADDKSGIEPPVSPLTPREIEVLELVSRGLPSKLIARELDVSESTVKFHLSSIYSKLRAGSRTEAVSRAARLGLITL